MRICTNNVFSWETCALESCDSREYVGPVMELKSDSRSSTANEQNVRNLNLDGVEGVTVADSSGVTITTTDQGSLAAAERISVSGIEEAFNFGGDALALVDRSGMRIAEIADRGGERLLDATSDALNFGDRALTRNTDLATDSLAFGGNVLAGAGELVRGAFRDAFDLAGDVLTEGQVQLGNTVSNLNAIARQQSTGDSERIQDIATKGLIGAGLVVVGVIVLAVFAGNRS
jgi:hypothetical protein